MATVFFVVGILVFLIIVHELGHFIAAKFFGVRVEEFGVGYPPRAYTLGRWGGTEYTLNWIPFGGFVRLFGDVGENEKGPKSFVSKNRAAQATILFAGVFMNAVAAWALFTGAFMVGVPRLAEDSASGSSLLIAEVVPGSPAAYAGLEPGDMLLTIGDTNGEQVFTERDAVTEFIRAHPGEELALTYKRGGEKVTVGVSPAHGVAAESTEKPAIGVKLVHVSTEPLALVPAMKEALFRTGDAFGSVAHGLWTMAKSVPQGAEAFKDIVGPVGLVGVVGAAAENGFGNVLALAAFISVNLVIVNLLPIPALDGGRLALLGIETVLRRSVSRLATRLFNIAGIAFIVFVMVSVTWNDIARLLM